jgi:hypothetical protein
MTAQDAGIPALLFGHWRMHQPPSAGVVDKMLRKPGEITTSRLGPESL